MRSACHFAEAYAAATGHPASPPGARVACAGPLLSVHVLSPLGVRPGFGFFRVCTLHAEQLRALGRLRDAAPLVDLVADDGRRLAPWLGP